MKPAEAPETLTLDELAALVDLPKRTVRYYIQLGLVDRPEGETRAARYGPRHAEIGRASCRERVSSVV